MRFHASFLAHLVLWIVVTGTTANPFNKPPTLQVRQDTVRARQDTNKARQDSIEARQDTVRTRQDVIMARRDADQAFKKIVQDSKMPKYVAPSLKRDITDWLAIGDSFSAGVSADMPADELNWYCSRFRKSYPNQINEDARFPGHAASRTFVFGSCTGAKMTDVVNNQIELGRPSNANYPKIGKPQMGTVSLSGNDLKFGDVSVH